MPVTAKCVSVSVCVCVCCHTHSRLRVAALAAVNERVRSVTLLFLLLAYVRSGAISAAVFHLCHGCPFFSSSLSVLSPSALPVPASG